MFKLYIELRISYMKNYINKLLIYNILLLINKLKYIKL